tara:strand:+ start:2000 stop:2923 length:924 start_codon:yes stop_codon:yes gene_type:complete
MKLFKARGKLNVFLLFFTFSVISSLIGKIITSYEKDITFRVIISDVPENNIIYDESHEHVKLKVKGYGFNLAKFYFNKPELKISANSLSKTNNKFIWEKNINFDEIKSSLSGSVDVIDISTDSILFYYDEYASAKKIIKTNIEINYEPGFDSYKKPLISNDSIKILGPKEILDKIRYIETKVTKLENINNDLEIDIGLVNPDYKNIILDFESIKYKLTVDQFIEESVSVPVDVIGDEDIKFTYFPKELNLKFSVSVNDQKKIDPNEFKIECIFNENNNYLIPQITSSPKFVKNIRMSSNQIELVILE